jgi:hypothetical protein
MSWKSYVSELKVCRRRFDLSRKSRVWKRKGQVRSELLFRMIFGKKKRVFEATGGLTYSNLICGGVELECCTMPVVIGKSSRCWGRLSLKRVRKCLQVPVKLGGKA